MEYILFKETIALNLMLSSYTTGRPQTVCFVYNTKTYDFLLLAIVVKI